MTEHVVRLALSRRTDFSLDVDFTLPASGFTVLFGPSGCGKTTVLRGVAGLERAHGRVVIGGEVWQDDDAGVFMPTYCRNLGYVFQEASLFPHLNVEKNLRFGLVRAKVADGDKRLAEAVELLGIGRLLKRSVDELSGGERQRCAIARALSLTPGILLMDEPLAALDWARKQEILPWLERLRDELRIPILYVTHASDEAARLADQMVLMRQGRVAAVGTVNEVLPLAAGASPAAEPEGRAVVLSGLVSQKDARWGTIVVDCRGDWRIEMAGDTEPATGVRLRIHARDVSVALARPEGGTSVRNILPAVVSAMKEDGAYAEVTLSNPAGGEAALVARVLRKSAADLGLTVGQRVWAQVKAAAVIR